MAWAMWLGAPVAATLLTALWVWWRGRPERAPTVQEAIQAHRDYLDALAVSAGPPPLATEGAHGLDR